MNDTINARQAQGEGVCADRARAREVPNELGKPQLILSTRTLPTVGEAAVAARASFSAQAAAATGDQPADLHHLQPAGRPASPAADAPQLGAMPAAPRTQPPAPLGCVLLAVAPELGGDCAHYVLFADGREATRGVAGVPGDVARVVTGALNMAAVVLRPSVLVLCGSAKDLASEPCEGWARAWAAMGASRRRIVRITPHRLEGEVGAAARAAVNAERAFAAGNWACRSVDVERVLHARTGKRT